MFDADIFQWNFYSLKSTRWIIIEWFLLCRTHSPRYDTLNLVNKSWSQILSIWQPQYTFTTILEDRNKRIWISGLEELNFSGMCLWTLFLPSAATFDENGINRKVAEAQNSEVWNRFKIEKVSFNSFLLEFVVDFFSPPIKLRQDFCRDNVVLRQRDGLRLRGKIIKVLSTEALLQNEFSHYKHNMLGSISEWLHRVRKITALKSKD